MPKIIENLATDILREAWRIIADEGAEALNMRKLSANLAIAPSTLYNYYRNKEEIIGALLRWRWEEALAKIDADHGDKAVAEALTAIVTELRKTVKPMIHLHLADAEGRKPQSDHGVEAQKKMLRQLRERVLRLLPREAKAGGVTEDTAGILTKLIMACVHDDTLDFADIIRAVKYI